MGIPANYPPQVTELLQWLIDKLLGKSLESWSLVVYGSLAKGTYRAERSDINLALVMQQVSREGLTAIRGPLRQAWRRGRVDTFILDRAQLPALAVSYPVKMLQLQWHHQVIVGEDPFLEIDIKPEQLSLRLEQDLQNHVLRLRHQYVMAGDSPPTLARVLRTAITALGVELSCLLHLRGVGIPKADEGLFSLASQNLAVDEALLQRLAKFRRGESVGELEPLYFALLAVVERLALQVREAKVCP